MTARFRFVAFLFLVAAIIFGKFNAAYADWWECYPVWGGEWNNVCETEIQGQILAQDSNPKAVFCAADFDDTCNPWCQGAGNVIGDTCYSDDDPQPQGGGWYSDTGFFIRCACSEVAPQAGLK